MTETIEGYCKEAGASYRRCDSRYEANRMIEVWSRAKQDDGNVGTGSYKER